MLLNRLMGSLLLLTCCYAPSLSPAQTAATPAATPEKEMTREERIKMHHDRIEKIIQENRKKQEEQQKAAQASMAAATGQNVANTTASSGLNAGAAPGQPIPAGPIQPATMTPPITGGQKQQAQAPQAARSESRTILMLDPMDSVVNIGDTFETDVVAESKGGSIDAVAFLLKYPNKLLNPLALDHREIDSMSSGEIQYSFDPDAGEIYFFAPLKSATKLADKSLVKITWEAIAPTDGTSISFAFDGDRSSGLYYKGTNLLGTVPNANDGVIKGTVMIRAPRSRSMVQKVAGEGLMISSEKFQPGPPVMQLRLDPNTVSAREGEEFDVDVVLDNPSAEPLDRLRLVAQFNPADLEVVDRDAGNGIRIGTNINDGAGAENFPFDFHKTNSADNATGLIVYDAAAEVTPVRGNGTVATIRFRARHAVEQTSINLLKNGSADFDGTDVSYLHNTMLAPTPGSLRTLDSVAVHIRPDPQGLERAAAARAQKANPFASRNGTFQRAR